MRDGTGLYFKRNDSEVVICICHSTHVALPAVNRAVRDYVHVDGGEKLHPLPPHPPWCRH